MKKIIFIGLLCLLGSCLIAQNDSIPEIEEEDYYTSIKDLREAEKFRFGVDLSTVTVHSLLGAPTRLRGSVIFNKKIKPNQSLRFIPAYEETRRYIDFNTTQFNVVAVTDSSVIYQDEYLDRYRITGRIGMEWFKQYSRNTTVYGVDLVLGYASERTRFAEWERTYDDDGNITPLSVGTAFFPTEAYYSIETFRYLVGIDFSIGYKVWLGEKVDLTVEWIPEISYRPFMKRNVEGNAVVTTEIPRPDILFDFRGLTLQLHYKFLKK